MYLSEMPTDLNKQGSPMIPPPAWFGPGITWDLPVKTVKSSGLGSQVPIGHEKRKLIISAAMQSRAAENQRIRLEIAKLKQRKLARAKLEKSLPVILVAAALIWYLSKPRP